MNDVVPTIVIIDDDPHVLKSLKFAFEVDGFVVRAFVSGEEVLDIPGLRAECFIMDQNLPGVSGLQTASLLRCRDPWTPIVLITTHPSRLMQERAGQIGVVIVEKPLTGLSLGQTVRELLGEASSVARHAGRTA